MIEQFININLSSCLMKLICDEIPEVSVRHSRSTREGNFIYLSFIKSHSRVLRACLKGTAHSHGYCRFASWVLHIPYTACKINIKFNSYSFICALSNFLLKKGEWIDFINFEFLTFENIYPSSAVH